MSRRQSFFAYAALLVGVVAFASSFARPSTAQQGATPTISAGRYQMMAGGNGSIVYLTDTATGHTWAHGNIQGSDWADFGTPPAR